MPETRGWPVIWSCRCPDDPAGARAGQIVTVDVEGTGPEAQFTFKGVPRPGAVPDVPPAEIDSKVAAGGTGGHLANGE